MQREYKLQLSLLIVMVLTISSATKGQQQQLKQQQLTAGAGKGTLLKCVIKCGILEELRGSTNLMSVVTELNDNLRRSDQISSAIELQLLNTKTSSNVSMDALLQAYTSIGSLNVTALLGSYSLSVELIAHKFNIPFFITSSFYAKHQHHLQKSHSSMTSSNHVLTVFPSPEQLYHVTTDLIRRLEWTSVAVLYDEIMQGVILLEDLVREPSVFVRAWKCSVDMENDTLRDALLDVRKMDITSLVVMTTRSLNNRILEKALRLSMLSYEYSWILPLLDQDDALIEAYANTGVSMYTMRLAHRSQQYYHAPSQHSSDNVRDTAEGYVGLDHVTGRRPTAAMWTKFERATIEDSLLTIYHVTRLQYRTTGKCNSWTSLDEMLSLLSSIDAEGTTGKLHYDQTGRRHGFTVNLFRLRPTGFYQVGMWNSSINERQARLQIFDDVIDPVKEAESDGTVNVRNEVLQIVAVMDAPFFMLKTMHKSLLGNDKYEGFLVDVMKLIAQTLRTTGGSLRYELKPTPDNRYGKLAADGSWDGLVQQLLDGKATLALGPLAVTPERNDVIDFTQPITRARLTAVGPHKDNGRFPDPPGKIPLRFFQPLSIASWLMLLIILPLAGIALFCIERFHQPSSTPPGLSAGDDSHRVTDPERSDVTEVNSSDDNANNFRATDCFQTFCLSLSNLVIIRTINSNNEAGSNGGRLSAGCVTGKGDQVEGSRMTTPSMTMISGPMDGPNSSNILPTSSTHNNSPAKRYLATITLTPIPQTTAGRLLVSAIWLFCAAMLAGYTANLAAILISGELRPPQLTFEQLYRRKGAVPLSWESIKYGTVKGSEVEAFFRRSTLFNRIWESMTKPEGAEPGVIYTPLQTVTSDMVEDPMEGLKRVRSGESPRYVFVWHQPGVRYYLWDDCDLALAESSGEYISLSIGVPKGIKIDQSDFGSRGRSRGRIWKDGVKVEQDKRKSDDDGKELLKDKLNEAIIKLTEEDEIAKLEQKWWGQPGCTERFPELRESDDTLGFGLEDLTGILSLFAAAILLSLLIGFIEYRIRVQRTSNGTRNRRPHDKTSSLCDGGGGRSTPTTQQLIPNEPCSVSSRATNIRQLYPRSRGGSTIGPGGAGDPFTESAYSANRGSSPEPFLLSRTSSEHPGLGGAETPSYHSRADQLLDAQYLPRGDHADACDFHSVRLGGYMDHEMPGDVDERTKSGENYGQYTGQGGGRYWGRGGAETGLADVGEDAGETYVPKRPERRSLASSSPRPSDPFADLSEDMDVGGQETGNPSQQGQQNAGAASKLATQRMGSSLSVSKQTHIF